MGVEIAGFVHSGQLLAAQVDHVRCQSAALRNPAPYRGGIHRIQHLGRLAMVIVRPLGPKSQAAWNPRFAYDVTQILSWGTAARMMVQAEAQKPSITTVSPELRRP
jgi:hypothetical protein